MRIEGSSAVVFGGGSGLGLATASGLVRAGARVVVADLPGDATRARVEAVGATFAVADVCDPKQVAEALQVAQQGGPLRIVTCSAGVATPGKLLGRDGPINLDGVERVLRVNLLGTVNVLRLAAEALSHVETIDGERGVIVLTASVAAYEGQIGQIAYAASKAGVAGLILPAARELAQWQVRVVGVAPGLFDTPLLAGLPEAARASLASQVPHPSRLGRPDEFAHLVTSIIENPMVNGTTIRLDGGIRMAPR